MYASEVYGVAESEYRRLRREAVAATGYVQAGRCVATVLRVLEQPDPELKLRRKQVAAWLEVWGSLAPEQRDGLRESWPS
eukprot:10765796-Lingulodinium_polyedra.AAC.1